MRRWGGRFAQQLVAATLAAKGRECHLAIPGVCVGTATTADHIVPRSRGGADALENLQPACLPCNQAKGSDLPPEVGDLAFFAPGAPVRHPVTLVIGPPCGGKTRWVAEQADPGDLVIDADALVAALTPGGPYQPDTPVRPVVDAVLRTVFAHVLDHPRPVWIITTRPTRASRALYRKYRPHIVAVTASHHVLRQRVADRPPQWSQWLDDWLTSGDLSDAAEVIHTDPGSLSDQSVATSESDLIFSRDPAKTGPAGPDSPNPGRKKT